MIVEIADAACPPRHSSRLRKTISKKGTKSQQHSRQSSKTPTFGQLSCLRVERCTTAVRIFGPPHGSRRDPAEESQSGYDALVPVSEPNDNLLGRFVYSPHKSHLTVAFIYRSLVDAYANGAEATPAPLNLNPPPHLNYQLGELDRFACCYP